METIRLDLDNKELDISVELLDEVQDPFSSGSNEFVYEFGVYISNGNNTVDFEYYTSINDYRNGKNYMDKEDIINAIQAIYNDAQAYIQNQNDVESFVEEFGYEDNYIKGSKIYAACEDTYNKLVKIHGTNFDDLAISDIRDELDEINLLQLEVFDKENIVIGEVVEKTKCIHVDFGKINYYDEVENLTEILLKEDVLDDEEFESIEDQCYPMYNYVWQLENEPSDSELRKIEEQTSSVAILKIDNEYYISLTSCGMDYSQSIAYTYLTIDNKIPEELMTINSYSRLDGAYSVKESGLQEIKNLLEKQASEKNKQKDNDDIKSINTQRA